MGHDLNTGAVAHGHFFEGPEKRLQIEFKENHKYPGGLRNVPREDWDALVGKVNALILSTTSTEHFDSYVLSESSLFVYPWKCMIKTCGTTTLLECIPLLMEYARRFELEVEYVTFSRRNFMCPDRQHFPHCSFEHEVEILNSIFNGSAYVLGSLTGEHWHLYVADYTGKLDSRSSHVRDYQCLEIMMSDLDRSTMRQFYKADPSYVDAKKTTETCGLAGLLPGTITDEHMFDPCGYSMNGHINDQYCTVHITPEAGFSYVSYETNAHVDCYGKLLPATLDIFRPGKFTAVVLADIDAKCGHSSHCLALKVPGYELSYKTSSDLGGTRNVTLVTYIKSAN